jgi:hypothetical protein
MRARSGFRPEPSLFYRAPIAHPETDVLLALAAGLSLARHCGFLRMCNFPHKGVPHESCTSGTRRPNCLSPQSLVCSIVDVSFLPVNDGIGNSSDYHSNDFPQVLARTGQLLVSRVTGDMK